MLLNILLTPTEMCGLTSEHLELCCMLILKIIVKIFIQLHWVLVVAVGSLVFAAVGSSVSACRLLVAASGIQFSDQESNPGLLHWERSLSHWITKEVPYCCLFMMGFQLNSTTLIESLPCDSGLQNLLRLSLGPLLEAVCTVVEKVC